MPYFYPTARKSDTVDNFHGIPVPDPYRWLEAMELPETRAWLEAEAALTTPFLEEIPEREQIKKRLTELWNFPRFNAPIRRGEFYFYFKNDGLQNQSVLYRQQGLNGDPQLIIDPNKFSEDGTVALVNIAFSKDGRYIAYARSTSGSDLQEIYVHDLNTGKDLDEVLKWGRFVTIAWKPDGSGFYYNRYPEPGSVPVTEAYTHNKLYFHRLDTPQQADTLVYERPDAKELGFAPTVSDDGLYLWLRVWHAASNKNRLYCRAMDSTDDFVPLIDNPNSMHEYIGSVGSTLYMLTDRDAPRGRIVAVQIDKPDQWVTIVPEGTDVIERTELIHHQLVVVSLHDAFHRLTVYNLDGTLAREISLPVMGSVLDLTGDEGDDECFVGFESFLYPPAVFRYDFTREELTPFRSPGLALAHEQYETHQVFAASKDGTRIPIFLTHKKGLRLDGQNPTLLYGYGGYSVNNTPYFRVGSYYWIEQGGVAASVVLRGGGEYGEDWHQAGMLGNKQNVFDDFIAASEWLVDAGYTSPRQLAIYGASNGGLLVAACMLQRPDLFGAVLCAVPVTDMLRYSKFTAGRFWVDEYGDAEGNAEHFQFLYAYSPAHNVQADTVYPPILIMTAESDDRVVPMHAMKLTAALQAAGESKNPILLRFEFKAGHGFGKPTAKLIEELADMFGFAYWAFRAD